MKFFLKDNIIYSIVNWDDEPIFLLDEASMGLPEVAIAFVLHVKSTGVIEPSVHSSLMVELHHLR